MNYQLLFTIYIMGDKRYMVFLKNLIMFHNYKILNWRWDSGRYREVRFLS